MIRNYKFKLLLTKAAAGILLFVIVVCYVSQFVEPGSQFTFGLKANRNSPKFIIMILTGNGSKYEFRRRYIRSEYLSYPFKHRADFKHFFFVKQTNATSVENEIHNDFLWYEGEDKYNKLSTKVWHGFQKLYDSYDFEYVVKTDDDTAVHLDALYHTIIHQQEAVKPYYGGIFSGHKKGIATGFNKSRKWTEMCPPGTNFTRPTRGRAQGSLYVLDKESIRKIVNLDIPPSNCEVSIEGQW